MTRVVADTNVYISAWNFGGVCDEIVSLAIAGLIDLYVSPPILEEIEAVLLRKFQWSEGRALAGIHNVQRYARLVSPQESLQVVQEDEPDNRILNALRLPGLRGL